MFKTLANVFRVPELRNKLLFTIGLLCVYRIGFYVPLPGVNAAEYLKNAGSDFGGMFSYLSMFSGGDLSQSTIFGLGIMPYISASIILQLLATVLPQLEKLRKEGEPGVRKINEWTRYLTVAVCLVQGVMWMRYISARDGGIYLHTAAKMNLTLFWMMGLATLTAGSLFLMWLGEQIEQYGIGNGVSLIITAGIISRMPNAISSLIEGTPFSEFGTNFHEHGFLKALQLAFDVQNSNHPYSFLTVIFIVAAFIFVVAGAILLTQAQRRIAIQQAKQMRGRRVYGGSKSYLPLRVNHAGVMPIIFASSLMVFPGMVMRYPVGWINSLSKAGETPPAWHGISISVLNSFGPGQYLYEVLYVALIFFFSYFWNTVQFQPKEMANQLRDYGHFIPGLRPGKRTADYLENVMARITYVGSAFLALIAVIPSLVANFILGNDAKSWQISQFLGGTGLLIVISVMLDLMNRLEANLVMRNYGGFLEGGGSGGKAKRSPGGPVRGGPRQPEPASTFKSENPKGLPA